MKKFLFVCLCALFSFSLTAQQHRVIISEVLYDTPVYDEGQGTYRHNGEFVSIYNFGNVPVNVSGWRLVGGPGQTFTFPQGSIMQPRARFFVAYRSRHTENFTLESMFEGFRPGTNDIIFYMNAIRLPNNGGGARLFRANGAMQDSIRYDGTSNRNQAPRLEAHNGELPSRPYVSLQRTNVTVREDGTIAFNPLDWVTQPVALARFPAVPFTESTESVYTNALQGVVDVTPSGALTFTIPIQVPAGTAGMQPQLAIVYNSQSNVNGILGSGFGLSGLSSITRVGRNFYHDGEQTGVTLTMNDHFALDGQRLIRTRGNHVIGENGVIFDTEMASFAEIESFGHGGSHLGPQRFEVRARDGSTLHYGGVANSRTQHTVSSQTVVSQWHISSKVDPNGNTIQFQYHTGAGWANQIREIRYGYAPGGGFLNRIEFNYILKPLENRRTLFLAGQSITDHRLLSDIRIYSGGQRVIIYRFEYTNSIPKRLLYMRKFAIENGREYMIGELRFDWNNPQQRFSDPTRWITDFFGSGSHGWNINYHPRMLADMTGDGRADVIGFGYRASEVGVSTGSRFSLDWWEEGVLSGNSGWNANRHSRHIADINGDGMMDVVGFFDDGVHVGLSNGRNGLSVSRRTGSFRATEGWGNISRHPRHVVDFDGDGLPDIIGHGQAHTYIALNTGEGFAPTFSTSTFAAGGPTFENGSISLVGDINGDGRMDVLFLRRAISNCNLFGNNCRDHSFTPYFALSYGDRLGASSAAVLWTGPISMGRRFNFFLADVNGDGKADLIFAGSSGLLVALSTGTGFLTPRSWTQNYGTNTRFSSDSRYIIKMADVNGDGMADVIAFYCNTVGVSLSTGNGFAPPIDWTFGFDYWGATQPRWDNNNNFRTIADVNGDGLPDLVGFDNYGVMVSLNLSGQPMLIGVRDNLGRIFTAEYDFLTNSAIYTRGTNPAPFPLMNFQGPLRVCTQLTTRSSDQRFTYEGAIVHQQGRGFLGFSRIVATDHRLQTRTVSEFELNTDFFVKLPRRTQTYSTANGTFDPVSEVVQYNSLREIVPGQRHRISNKVRQTTRRDFVAGSEQRSRFTYDSYGNLLSDTTFKGQFAIWGADPTAVFITRNTFTNSANRTIRNRLETTISYSYYIESPSQRFEQRRRFAYDPRGNLTQRIDRYRSDSPVTTSYAVNSRGLVTRATVSAHGVQNMVQEFGYDPHFRFRTWQRTVGLGTSSQTFNIWGQVLSQTSIGGLTTWYQYDAFGRLVRVRCPEGITTTRTIRNERNERGAVHTLTVQQAGRPDVVSFLDTLGRTIKTKTQNPSGTVITRTVFNDRGQVVQTDMPHFEIDMPRRTTFEYDEFGRLKTRTFVGLTTFYNHSARQLGRQHIRVVSITDPDNRTTHKAYNFVGDLLSSEDAMGGSVSYGYYAPGLVRSITAPGGATTVIERDCFGRQTALIEPNAGRIEFEYDAFDRIIRQTDARGNITENEFDRFGRLRETVKTDAITGERRVTTYAYITNTNDPNLGRLRSITTNNGTAHIFEYDQFGRIVRFQDVSESNTFITEYTYDRYGNLLTYRFPSGFTLFYVYDDNGFKTEIRENNAAGNVIWQFSEVNALGQERRSFADGRLRTQDFNEFGQPTRMTVQGLMDFRYEYDRNTGNMRSRRNDYNRTNETFSYDNLNRLTSGVTFSPCGNITWKEGVGEFIHNAFRPHAVDTILGFLDPRFDHDITYTSFQKIQTITAHNSPALLNANFVYGPNRQRRQMNVLFGDNVLSKHYTQNFEVSYINGTRAETKEYIFSPFGLVAIRNNGRVNAVATDHLGSIVARFNPRKGVYEYFGFTPWGRRYRYENGTKHFFDETFCVKNILHSPFSILNYFARGFTGHEHMDIFGLINMNGRMYDPIIGRFLSPDPFVPDATFTQDFNRYMYARNNPLTYVDPDGELVTLAALIGVGVGAIMGGITGHRIGQAQGATGWSLFGYVVGGAAIGGLAGGLGTAAATSITASTLAAGGTAMQAAVASGMVGGMVTGGINGLGMTALAGGGFTDIMGGMVQGAVVGGFSGAAGGATHQLLNRGGGRLFRNTLAYMGSSTASQMTANILTGQNPFNNLDYGLNWGIALPLFADLAPRINPLRMHLARRHNTKPDHEIRSLRLVGTEFADNGDLNMGGVARGTRTIPGYTRNPSQIEIIRRFRGASVDWRSLGFTFQGDFPLDPVHVPTRQVPFSGFVNFPFMRSYGTMIHTLSLHRALFW